MNERFDGFSVNIFLDDDGDWLAHLVELPEVSAFADTALQNLIKPA
jgi:predicted RNase H-like HicB family nuclease